MEREIDFLNSSDPVCPHFLPCTVEENGKINAAKYFSPFISKLSNGSANIPDNSIVAFRGREIEGTDVSVPDGYEGLLLSKNDEYDSQSRTTAVGSFSNITIWSWRGNSDAGDAAEAMLNSIELCKLSNAVHHPIPVSSHPNE